MSRDQARAVHFGDDVADVQDIGIERPRARIQSKRFVFGRSQV